MKMLLAAAAASWTLSMGGTASAADLRPLLKAPPPPPVLSWTGCYVGIGAGYGKYSEEMALVTVRPLPGIPAGTTFVDGITQGARLAGHSPVRLRLSVRRPVRRQLAHRRLR